MNLFFCFQIWIHSRSTFQILITDIKTRHRPRKNFQTPPPESKTQNMRPLAIDRYDLPKNYDHDFDPNVDIVIPPDVFLPGMDFWFTEFTGIKLSMREMGVVIESMSWKPFWRRRANKEKFYELLKEIAVLREDEIRDILKTRKYKSYYLWDTQLVFVDLIASSVYPHQQAYVYMFLLNANDELFRRVQKYRVVNYRGQPFMFIHDNMMQRLVDLRNQTPIETLPIVIREQFDELLNTRQHLFIINTMSHFKYFDVEGKLYRQIPGWNLEVPVHQIKEHPYKVTMIGKFD